ncbi:MAG: imidazolonepropionase [Sulfobacillus benefaciens]|uniref:Imidazolonepropionase n=1 Tax=Sulfobacillus benefaciens TaxID=453960 RepID=A0A2T2XCK9_9FIRM|nr:MAG: imidazolonepropionase [Sulfobacillus benefaciens]
MLYLYGRNVVVRQAIIHAKLYSLSSNHLPLRGRELGSLEILPDGALVMDHGVIIALGTTTEILSQNQFDTVIDVQGRIVIPGFVDCHTHLPFADWRADEYRRRLFGQQYQEIARKKGGITRSSLQLGARSDAEVAQFTEQLVYEMLTTGTTTLEMKSGYGLTMESELRQLRLISGWKLSLDQRISATGLFLHAVPPGLSRQEWLTIVRHDLLPRAHEERLIDAIDAFIEETAFSPQEIEPVLQDALRRNIPIRLHTDQFTNMGGTLLGLTYQARGIDHLDHLADQDIARLASSNTVAVLLPGASYSMNHTPHPPARRLIEAGAAIALATDFNPGTAPISSMPLIISLAVHLYGLTPEEALAATTINAAYVLGLDKEVGSLAIGKRADLLILDSDQLESIPYRAGHNPVNQVFVRGKPVTLRSATSNNNRQI